MAEDSKLHTTRTASSSPVETAGSRGPVLTGGPIQALSQFFLREVDLLKAQFSPEPDPADLSDIPPDPPRDSEGPRWEIT